MLTRRTGNTQARRADERTTKGIDGRAGQGIGKDRPVVTCTFPRLPFPPACTRLFPLSVLACSWRLLLPVVRHSSANSPTPPPHRHCVCVSSYLCTNRASSLDTTRLSPGPDGDGRCLWDDISLPMLPRVHVSVLHVAAVHRAAMGADAPWVPTSSHCIPCLEVKGSCPP